MSTEPTALDRECDGGYACAASVHIHGCLRPSVEQDRHEQPCWCFECDRAAGGETFHRTRMNLCPDCGNKRCPRSTSHANDCSGSNAVGQAGSIYGDRVAERWDAL